MTTLPCDYILQVTFLSCYNTKLKNQNRREKINSHVYGKTLTNDEIIEQPEKEMQEQQCKKKTKTKRKEPVIEEEDGSDNDQSEHDKSSKIDNSLYLTLFQIDEFICQVSGLDCNDETEDDQLKLWIGCDLCWSGTITNVLVLRENH